MMPAAIGLTVLRLARPMGEGVPGGSSRKRREPVKIMKLSALAAAAAVVGLASCSDSTSVVSRLLPDSTVTAEVAVSAGDALAQAVNNMMANEAFSSLSTASNAPAAVSSLDDFNRTRTCYDAN